MVLKRILPPLVLAFVVGGLATSAASATEQGSAAPAVTRATVKVAPTKLGRILVDGRGRTLYLFTAETRGSIVCKSDFMSCTRLWPPLLSQGKARAGAGANARLVGSIRRTKPAGTQVTYKGHPLYFFKDDRKPGDTKGQAYLGLWYVLSPRGTAIRRT